MAFQDGSQESRGGDSQGLKQRLASAQALMEKPSLLVLDEPLNAIGSKSVAYFRRLFLELNEKEGVPRAGI